jgi:hypothetical protein
MGEEQSPVGAPVSGEKDPEQIRQEIEATRQELGDTVEALVAKTDVKAIAHEKVESAKASVARPQVIAVAVALVVGFAAWRLTKR